MILMNRANDDKNLKINIANFFGEKPEYFQFSLKLPIEKRISSKRILINFIKVTHQTQIRGSLLLLPEKINRYLSMLKEICISLIRSQANQFSDTKLLKIKIFTAGKRLIRQIVMV